MFASRVRRLSSLYNIAYHRKNSTNGPAGPNPTKNARSARRNQPLESKNTGAESNNVTKVAVVLAIAGIGYAVYDINNNPNGIFTGLYQSSGAENLVKWAREQASSRMTEVMQPAVEKLIPDFGDEAVYGPMPPGAIAPPLLVIDLEKTLVGSYYDVSLGWRYAKRPGVDKFITTLSSYYEIAIFSDSDLTGPEVWTAIDPENRCHHLFGNGGELRDNRILKRLDKMNRDIRKIVLIDDNEITSQLCPRNTLLVKPFTNLEDQTDTVLFDLIPLLQAFVHEGSKDFRDTIDKLGTHNAQEAAIEYQMRVSRAKEEEYNRRYKGLGGILRPKSRSDEIGNLAANQSKILSPIDIVGPNPGGSVPVPEEKENPVIPEIRFKGSKKPAEKKTGTLFEWIENTRKEKEIKEHKKRELMNEIYIKRMEEKKTVEGSM